MRVREEESSISKNPVDLLVFPMSGFWGPAAEGSKQR